MVAKEIRLRVELSPCELADIILRMGNDDKARFMNAVGFCLSLDVYDIYSLDLREISASGKLDKYGMSVLPLFNMTKNRESSEKQTAKPVRNVAVAGNIRTGDCPACATAVTEKEWYCYSCGQRLGWDGTERSVKST